VGGWWAENVIDAGRLPLLLCLTAFVLTFVLTRVITRMIRAGVGPFRNNVSESGVHIHHAVPGIILLIVGALMSLATGGSPWVEIAAVTIGVGMSLILDEFALILHLQDVYWSNEGRISVELIGLTAACMGLVMLGFTPLSDVDFSAGDLTINITLGSTLAIHAVFVLVCVLKAKYRTALISCFVPFVAWVSAFRLARPTSWWARKRYKPKKLARAVARQRKFDGRWDPLWRWVGNLIAGKVSQPDPDAEAQPALFEPPPLSPASVLPLPHTASQHGASQHGASQHAASQHAASQHAASQHTASQHTASQPTPSQHNPASDSSPARHGPAADPVAAKPQG